MIDILIYFDEESYNQHIMSLSVDGDNYKISKQTLNRLIKQIAPHDKYIERKPIIANTEPNTEDGEDAEEDAEDAEDEEDSKSDEKNNSDAKRRRYFAIQNSIRKKAGGYKSGYKSGYNSPAYRKGPVPSRGFKNAMSRLTNN
jgi:hypothetical protein